MNGTTLVVMNLGASAWHCLREGVAPQCSRAIVSRALSGKGNVSAKSRERAQPAADFLLRKRLDAVIAVAPAPNEAEIQQLLANHPPIVGIGGALPGASTIRINDSGLAWAAASHLIGLGSSVERPTSVFAASDEIVIGTILAARDFGLRVPDDLSVMGTDGHELGEVFRLTTINHDARGQGALAVRLMLEARHSGADDSPPPGSAADKEYPPEFVIRTGTAVSRVSLCP